MNKHLILSMTFLMLCLLAIKLEGPDLDRSIWRYNVTDSYSFNFCFFIFFFIEKRKKVCILAYKPSFLSIFTTNRILEVSTNLS